ncbi:MAG: nucleotidyltransferase [Eubacterium sp.]|nr:nucleotidyltransferase [Eubacterium sp.]
MRTVGIIAEYNPFHNGHAYQIKRAKELTNADYCVVVMSGDFVQRGTPALMDKHLRAQAALLNGADLVLELPVYYALSSAEYFAGGAVALLDRLGIVDALCFGSECGDIRLLTEFAKHLLHEDDVFKETLSRNLRMGHSYPQARNAALEASAPHLTAHINVLTTPNNILGIEYCKALLSTNSRIEPYTLRRTGSSYHDNGLSSGFCSALALRESLRHDGTPENIAGQVPESALLLMQTAYQKTYPVFADDFSLPMQYKLLSEEALSFTRYPDIDKELSDRIVKFLPQYKDFRSFCDLLKSKNRTYARISRCLMHILLGLMEEDFTRYRKEGQIFYARMLGFREEAAPLLSAIKANASIPLLSKLADAEKQLAPTGLSMLEKDVSASHIYQSVARYKFPGADSLPEINEYKRPIIKI